MSWTMSTAPDTLIPRAIVATVVVAVLWSWWTVSSAWWRSRAWARGDVRAKRCRAHPAQPLALVCIECFESDRTADATDRAKVAEASLAALTEELASTEKVARGPADTMTEYLIALTRYARQRDAYERTTYAVPFPSFLAWVSLLLRTPEAQP